MSGARAHRTGLAAEESVLRAYRARGYVLREHRWRGAGGEVDLILEHDGGLVFVEVKAARDFARAAESLSPRQMGRIAAAAGEYLGRMPQGQATQMRFDVALVDRQGQVELLEGAFGV